MRLYHGSNQLITEIDLEKSKDYKDFGRGFYMTRDYARSVAMAKRTTTIMGEGSPEVVPYLFYPEKCSADVRILKFAKRTADWALFVLRNRYRQEDIHTQHNYDIVIGPVADSRVDAVLNSYMKKYQDDYANPGHLQELTEIMKYPGAEYIQYCFCTQKGIDQLILDL